MSSGVSKTRVGSFSGTGAIFQVRGVEFRPRKVELYNEVTNLGLTWVDGMADDAARKVIGDGTRTVITANGVTPRSDGFDIGTDALNTATQLVRWVAHE